LFTVALWQMMTFLMLILLVWLNELMDLSALWFGTHPTSLNVYRGSALTIGVIIVAIVAVGNTYVQQKRIITGLLTVCSGCRKIRVDEHLWEQLDDYVSEHSLALISHGLCPQCFERMKKEISDLDTPAK